MTWSSAPLTAGAPCRRKEVKDEVKDVREGYECGAAFEGYNDLQVGDVIECFDVKEVVRDFEASDQSLAAS